MITTAYRKYTGSGQKDEKIKSISHLASQLEERAPPATFVCPSFGVCHTCRPKGSGVLTQCCFEWKGKGRRKRCMGKWKVHVWHDVINIRRRNYDCSIGFLDGSRIMTTRTVSITLLKITGSIKFQVQTRGIRPHKQSSPSSRVQQSQTWTGPKLDKFPVGWNTSINTHDILVIFFSFWTFTYDILVILILLLDIHVWYFGHFILLLDIHAWYFGHFILLLDIGRGGTRDICVISPRGQAQLIWPPGWFAAVLITAHNYTSM